MGRKQVDRYHCAECGADTELIAGANHAAGEEETACCRYCGNEITLSESGGQKSVLVVSHVACGR